MNYYLFQTSDPEKAEKELSKQGLKDLYWIEQNGEVLIGGRSAKRPKKLQHCQLVEEKQGEVDWTEQWSLFAEGFSDGKAHIDLARFGGSSTLQLLPGPGFGDLSHPTTHLMLEMMQGRVKNHPVLDIGTGSGILALAALLLGADSAIGLDIDGPALEHAKQNAKLNHLKARFLKSLPASTPTGQVTLINMIFPEQKSALRRIEKYNSLTRLWIASGILKEQKKEYLQQTREWGWEVLQEFEREEWLGWVFKID
ncbi:MAG: 50S ribosomal protein L11 methyltransferase [Verrucomicrobia bacterium]|nr:50S ribosomal protein L11 methyltransferase [Verrucomicrobiota bacterium]